MGGCLKRRGQKARSAKSPHERLFNSPQGFLQSKYFLILPIFETPIEKSGNLYGAAGYVVSIRDKKIREENHDGKKACILRAHRGNQQES
jgi:hypothetical protein